MNLLLDTLLVAQDTIATAATLPHDAVAVDSLILSKQTIEDLIEASKEEPSITDWLQAGAAIFGVVVAFVAGVYAVLSYRNTIQQQQDQIDDQQKELHTLAKIAEGLSNQVKVATERRRLEIRPKLSLYSKRYNGTYFGIAIENTGGTATDVTILSPPDPHESCLDEIEYSFKGSCTVIYHKDKPVIEVRVMGSSPIMTLEHFEFSIYYTDNDGNEYAQYITGKDGNLQCSLPSYLGHISEWGNSQYDRANKYKKVYDQIYDIATAVQ